MLDRILIAGIMFAVLSLTLWTWTMLHLGSGSLLVHLHGS